MPPPTHTHTTPPRIEAACLRLATTGDACASAQRRALLWTFVASYARCYLRGAELERVYAARQGLPPAPPPLPPPAPAPAPAAAAAPVQAQQQEQQQEQHGQPPVGSPEQQQAVPAAVTGPDQAATLPLGGGPASSAGPAAQQQGAQRAGMAGGLVQQPP